MLYSFAERSPDDRWLSIAETFGLLPVDEAGGTPTTDVHDALSALDALQREAAPSGP